MQKQVLPEESRAVDALARKTLKDAVSRQEGANTAFAQAETQFDELIRLIIDKLDSARPTDAGAESDLGGNAGHAQGREESGGSNWAFPTAPSMFK